MINNPLLAGALEYAAKGTPVFPCRPNDKRPATPNGFKDRTTDPAQIEAWWTAEPQANIGIVPADQGLTVIDLDGIKGFENWQELFDYDPPETYTVRTPSGGYHHYFKGMLDTNGKLAPGIDIRSTRGYVLAPPSVVNGNHYEVDDRYPPAPLPALPVNDTAPSPKAAPPGVEEDSAYNVAQAIGYLTQRAPLAIEGAGGDQTTFTVAAAVRDYGVSEYECFHLMEEHWNARCSPPWTYDELAEKVHHAYSYAQNEAGCLAAPKEVVEGWIAEAHAARAANPPVHQARESSNPWTGVDPEEFEALPDLDYWDGSKVLPRIPGGATVIIYGDFGSHKTNTTLAMMMDAIFDKGARVAFCAGEGAYGLGKERIPAHARARGLTSRDLKGKLRIVAGVPALADKGIVAEFCAAQKEFAPDVVVLDTFSTAIVGMDENSSEAAQALTGNGTVGQIRRELGALVILPAHAGKDRSRGIRGNSGFGGNADVIIACEADKDAGTVRLTVEKMRDGPDGHSIYFSVNKEGVPVPVRITEREYEERRAGAAGKKAGADDDEGVRLTVKLALAEAGARSFMSGLTDRLLAERITGEYPTGDDEAARQWVSQVNSWEERLRGARNKARPWQKGLHSYEASHSGEKAKNEHRWFYPVQATQGGG